MILVFDIGKTNKKWVLFDEQLKLVADCTIQLPETKDEDGFPCENISLLQDWVFEESLAVLKRKDVNVKYINISAYGATIVFLDENDSPCFPVYNYLIPIEAKELMAFRKEFDQENKLEIETGAPLTGMLNTGFQIYKASQKKNFSKVKTILHLPQYLVFLLHGTLQSETTSIGCHTALWNFDKNDWHQWVGDRNLKNLLPAIVDGKGYIPVGINGKVINIGKGIHDSSAALFPYVSNISEPFILVSTGTWSIVLNPFTKDAYSGKDVNSDVLMYRQPNGSNVRASRLFTGRMFSEQVDLICKKFEVERTVVLQMEYVLEWQNLCKQNEQVHQLEYEVHKLCNELCELHIQAIHKAMGSSDIKSVYVDGGFAQNQIFLKLLKAKLPQFRIFAARKPMGSALGAALVLEVIKPEDIRFTEIYDIIEI